MAKSRSYDNQTLQMFWRAILREKRLLVLALLFPLGAIFLTVGVPLVIGRIIASLGNPAADPMRYLPALVAAGLVGIISNRLGARYLFTMQARLMARAQEQAYTALIRRSMGFHNNNVGGKLVSDSTDYPSAFAGLMDALFTNLLPFALILVCGSGLVFMESWQLGLVVTTMSVYALTSAYITSRKLEPARRLRQEKGKTVTAHVADSIVNVPTVKTFAHEQRELARFQRLNDELQYARSNDWRTGSAKANTRIAVLFVMQVLFIIVLIDTVRQNPSVLDIGIFAFSFVTTINMRLIQLGVLMRQIEDSLLNASPITEVLQQEPEIQDIPGAKPLQVSHGSIQLDDVEFHYDDSSSDNSVFRQLSLHIKPGEKVGLVGPSGGGKSTLTRLLLRFEEINGGTITIDGQNIAEVTQESLRQAISYVPQEPLLFHRSIAENIAYGKPDASPKDIERAAKLAYADEFIRDLTHGYDTIVGERGVKLSGGQRQRVAIARAILKDAPILLLDEATSALDSESEVYIQKALLKLMRNRTTLVIAHRLSTVQKMDRIIVLEDGKLTEQGSHAELLEQSGTYAKLWSHQSGGFIDD